MTEFIIVAVVVAALVSFGAYKLFGASIKARIEAEVDDLHATIGHVYDDVHSRIDDVVDHVNDKIAGK